MHCLFCIFLIRNSINVFSSLSYTISSVGSDYTGQAALCTSITEPCSFLGPLLIGSGLAITVQPAFMSLTSFPAINFEDRMFIYKLIYLTIISNNFHDEQTIIVIHLVTVCNFIIFDNFCIYVLTQELTVI